MPTPTKRVAILQADETVLRVERMTEQQRAESLTPWWSPELAQRVVLDDNELCEPGWSLQSVAAGDGELLTRAWAPPSTAPDVIDVDDVGDGTAPAVELGAAVDLSKEAYDKALDELDRDGLLKVDDVGDGTAPAVELGAAVDLSKEAYDKALDELDRDGLLKPDALPPSDPTEADTGETPLPSSSSSSSTRRGRRR